ncbi:MAG: phosphogluconate dehydrogenase (NAD(+)-dependent, decarboxylating) [Candidatus Dormibacteraceae bacterium]
MELAMIGLGRMGSNMVVRLLRAGHRVAVYDRDPAAVQRVVAEGAVGSNSMSDLLQALPERPRVVWVMVPAGLPTSQTIAELGRLLSPQDMVIDGGNTEWHSALADAAGLREQGIRYLDAGTSGGVWGLEEGYCLMVGGQPDAYNHCQPIFKALAPPDGGLVHTGPEGSGHFVKMVHNGVEYALMQAYAEGFEIMAHASEFPDLNMLEIAQAWRKGSVVRSWLLDLISEGLSKDPRLEQIEGWVEDTGEGRWTVQAAMDNAIPAPTITMALFERFRSRQENTFANRLLAMMRNEFGGHAVHPASTSLSKRGENTK